LWQVVVERRLNEQFGTDVRAWEESDDGVRGANFVPTPTGGFRIWAVNGGGSWRSSAFACEERPPGAMRLLLLVPQATPEAKDVRYRPCLDGAAMHVADADCAGARADTTTGVCHCGLAHNLRGAWTSGPVHSTSRWSGVAALEWPMILQLPRVAEIVEFAETLACATGSQAG
jgi:hypothetical protein